MNKVNEEAMFKEKGLPLNENVTIRIVVVLKLMSIDEILSDVFLVAMNVQL